jgi:hypothetical protein
MVEVEGVKAKPEQLGSSGEGEDPPDQALWAYLAGYNDRRESMERTTPLFSASSGHLFVTVPGYHVRCTAQLRSEV